jgi:uncharacterized protein YggE
MLVCNTSRGDKLAIVALVRTNDIAHLDFRNRATARSSYGLALAPGKGVFGCRRSQIEREYVRSMTNHSRKEENMRLTRKTISAFAVAGFLAIGGGLLMTQNASARINAGAPAKQSSTAHLISAGGHGEVSVAPDMATLTVGVQSKGQDANEALARNATAQNAVIAAVEAQGVPASHIQTTNLSLYFDSQGDNYIADHELTIRIDAVSRVGAILDAAVGAGANNSWGVGFGLKDQSAARSQALQAAVKDARSRADAMASGLGVSVTGVASASEASYNVQYPQPYAAASRAAAPGGTPTPVQPGELTITADVNVAFTF